MKRILLLLTVIVLGACATKDGGSQRENTERSQNQSILDFIDVRELQEVDKLRSTERDGWDTVTMSYVIYKARRDRYLVEFSRPCYELRDNREVTPDLRTNPNVIRSKFDTLRGCRIARIFALSPDEAEELKNIGEAPGNRN